MGCGVLMCLDMKGNGWVAVGQEGKWITGTPGQSPEWDILCSLPAQSFLVGINEKYIKQMTIR